MSKKKKQPRGPKQKPLDPGLSEEEARELMQTSNDPLDIFRAMAALGLVEMFGNPSDPTIRLTRKVQDWRASENWR